MGVLHRYKYRLGFVYRNLQKSGILGTVIGMLLGMAKYESGDCVASVFERADIAMYNDKADLKASIT